MCKLQNNQCFVSKDTELYQISDYDVDGAGRHKSHTHTHLIDNWCRAGNFLKAQFAHCRISVIDPVSEENQKFFWEWVLEEIIEKLKENN